MSPPTNCEIHNVLIILISPGRAFAITEVKAILAPRPPELRRQVASWWRGSSCREMGRRMEYPEPQGTSHVQEERLNEIINHARTFFMSVTRIREEERREGIGKGLRIRCKLWCIIGFGSVVPAMQSVFHLTHHAISLYSSISHCPSQRLDEIATV